MARLPGRTAVCPFCTHAHARRFSPLMLLPGEIDITRHAPEPGCSPEEAQKYTKWLATHHYENFNVVSWLLPKRLHQHFYNLYAYCRWSDDLGDEIPVRQRALELLDAWEDELHLCYVAESGP